MVKGKAIDMSDITPPTREKTLRRAIWGYLNDNTPKEWGDADIDQLTEKVLRHTLITIKWAVDYHALGKEEDD